MQLPFCITRRADFLTIHETEETHVVRTWAHARDAAWWSLVADRALHRRRLDVVGDLAAVDVPAAVGPVGAVAVDGGERQGQLLGHGVDGLVDDVVALAPDEEVEACHDDHCTNHTESKIEMISLVYME